MSEIASERPFMGGTDGFRGEYTEESTPGAMNKETVSILSYVLGELGRDGSDEFVVGCDTRPFNDDLMAGAVAGIRYSGGDVLMLGEAPTPAVQKITKEYGYSGAVVLTASHNPVTDGGWKGLVGPNKPTKPQVEQINAHYWNFIDSHGKIDVKNSGITGADTDYVRRQHLRQYVSGVVNYVQEESGLERPLDGKTVLVDAAYGAAMEVGPEVFNELGATVISFACNKSRPINYMAGATNQTGVKNLFIGNHELAREVDYVIQFDGDADRFMGVGVDMRNHGPEFSVFSGNHTLELLGKDEPGVVGTVYTNDASIERLRQSGVDFDFCPNGDTEVTSRLRELGWKLGGDATGHTVDLTWLPSGDGILSGARVAARLAASGVSMAEYIATNPLNPEVMKKIKLPYGYDYDPAKIEDVISPYSSDKENNFRTVIRPSGTEPVIRVWGTASSEGYLINRLSSIITSVELDVLKLKS